MDKVTNENNLSDLSLMSETFGANANNTPQVLCTVYRPDNTSTVGFCLTCGKNKWEHNEIKVG